MNEQIKKLIIDVIGELNYDPSDIELQKYLYEKGMKAFQKINLNHYSMNDIRNFLINNIPTLMKEYVRMKNAIETKKADSTNFGVSINYQLLELFKYINLTSSEDEFSSLKKQFLQSQPFVFPGLWECSLAEIKNIYQNIIANCDVITPEAEAKMTITISENIPFFTQDGTLNLQLFNFSYLDQIISFAKENQMKVRLHTLIWHKHFPKILENCTSEQIIDFLDTYFAAIAKRYGNDIFYSIDVLNEIAADIHSEEFKKGQILRESKWKEKLGYDYYLTVLKLARKNFPNSLLVYNEYDETNDEKRKRMITIIDKIKQEEKITGTILLNCVGLQSHYHQYTTDEEIKSAYSDLYQTGKELQVSELDVATIEKKDNVQIHRVFRTVLDCASSYQLKSFTCWGPSSSISWKTKQVSTFLNDFGEIDENCKEIVKTFSQKEKRKYNMKTDVNSSSIS